MSIRNQLTKLAVMKMRTGTGETYAEILKREVDRLYDCIQDEIERFYRSYEPSVYKRTWRFQGSLYAEDLVDIRINGDQVELSLKFHPDLVFHENFDGSHESHIGILMNYGYVADELEKRIGVVPYFTRRDGFFFIENGIMRWNKSNSLGIQIDVTAIYNGRQFSYF